MKGVIVVYVGLKCVIVSCAKLTTCFAAPSLSLFNCLTMGGWTAGREAQ